MEINSIVELITNSGVTVAALAGMGIAIVKIFQKYAEVRDKSDEVHKEQMDQIKELTAAINNNTVTLTQLVAKIDK